MASLEKVGAETYGIGQLYQQMAAVSRNRLLLQEANISIRNTPLGGEIFANEVKRLTANSVTGFSLTQRAEAFTKAGLKDFLTITKPVYQTSAHPVIITASKEVSAFTQAQATYIYLQGLKEFSFADVGEPIDDNDLGPIEYATSFWRSSVTPEALWSLVNLLDETADEILYSKDPLLTSKLLFIAHFFTAGAVLANKIM